MRSVVRRITHRASRLTALVTAMVWLSGCLTAGYVIQAGLGQLRLLGQARPIAEVIADPEVDARTKALLGRVPDILAYASKRGLADQGNYREYVELDRPSVVWFMAASRPLAFEPRVWSFPIVGSFTYVGWFDYREARTIERILLERGWDVHIRRVHAYSTGGWFHDPILSSMLSDEDDAVSALAHVLFHELTHANVLMNDQSTFNESIASFVGDTMTEEYLIERFGDDSPVVTSYRTDLAEDNQRGARLASAYGELDALYKGNEPVAVKLASKRRVLDRLEFELGLPYRVNNASLINFKTYNAGMAEFTRLYQTCSKNWLRFLAAVKSLRPAAFGSEQTDDIGPVITALTSKGCPDTVPKGAMLQPGARGFTANLRPGIVGSSGSPHRPSQVAFPDCRARRDGVVLLSR